DLGLLFGRARVAFKLLDALPQLHDLPLLPAHNLYQGRKRLGDLLQCWPPDVAARKELGRARDESLQHEAQVVFDALIVWRESHVAALCHVAMPPAASLAHTQQPARAYLPAKRT